ncbi:MAG: phosphonoacetaldehyde reductase [Planctomycetota bacterium]|nr:phosphonoacetaldehyde reductase [Planctomycetota bacterium]
MFTREDSQLIARSLGHAGALLDAIDAPRVLLVLDRGVADATGADATLRRSLGGRIVGTFTDFTPNPRSDQALAAARAAIDLRADALLALGGGSCLDVAKVGALGAGMPNEAPALVRGSPNAHVAPRPVVAIPTTSGTGSEATHFAAIYVDGHKVSVAHPAMRPRAVVLDVTLHMAMPASIAAATGLDALCQAVESHWASGATDTSRAHAMDALALIAPHLAPSVRGHGTKAAPVESTEFRAHREAMMLGAHRAGRAINISKTTASHALSYELTTRFNIPHGLAVALTLGHVAAFNDRVCDADCTHPGGPEVARRCVREACRTLEATPEELAARLRDLLTQLGQPPTLAAAGVRREALAPMAAAADTVRLSNNPRRLTEADALSILTAAY